VLACVVLGSVWTLTANVLGTGADPAAVSANVAGGAVTFSARFDALGAAPEGVSVVRKSAPAVRQASDAIRKTYMALLDVTYSLGPPPGSFSTTMPRGPDRQLAACRRRSNPTRRTLHRRLSAPPTAYLCRRRVPPRSGCSPVARSKKPRQRFCQSLLKKPSVFEKLYGKPQAKGSLLAFASADFGDVSIPNPAKASAMGNAAPYDRATAVYDISARTVYLPDGTRLEAHSGLGAKLDDPRYVHVRMHGATPPHVYELEPREALFHGVPALRLKPVGGEEAIFGRTGLLAHTYMLAPTAIPTAVSRSRIITRSWTPTGIGESSGSPSSRAWSDGATGDVPNRQRKSMLRRMIPRGVPSSSMSWNFRAARSSILSRSLRNCCSRWPGAVRVAFSRSSIAAGADRAGHLGLVVHHREQHDHAGRTRRFGMILLSAPSGCSCRRTSSAHDSIFAFRNHGLSSAILRRQSASVSCGPETNVPLTLVLYHPDSTPRRSDSSVLTWRGEKICMGCFQGGRSTSNAG